MKVTLTQPDYRELINNLSGVIYTTDIRGIIEFASAGVFALTGYTPEELVGQHFSFLVDPEYLSKVYDHYTAQIDKGERETTLEFYCQSRTKEKKWVEQTALLLRRNDGSKGFQCFVKDISEKRDFQRQLIAAKTAAEQAKTAAEEAKSAAEEAKTEAEEAQTEAEEARKMQEKFLANMSHEIRTPMNGIVGMTNLLLETTLSSTQEQFAGVIRSSADNLLVIIDDILDFSKIKAGKLAIEKIPFRLQDVTANIWALFEQRIIKKGLQFSMELDPNIPDSLVGDPHRLNQVLINLVGNAVKFTEKGSIKLAVTLEKKQPSEKNQSNEKKQSTEKKHPNEKKQSRSVNLLFTVTDTGIGITPEQLPHIFDSFAQAAPDISRKYGGTGLGLAICHQLLALQGGTITVTSEPGKGTGFVFSIPYGCEKTVEANPQIAQSPQHTQQVFAGKHFLVVEDNPINQQLIEHVIKKAGASVTLANHGKEAIDQLEAKPFDLIIMDLQMPVMDGYETTSYLRNTMKLRTPVLAMTANALKGEQVRCLEVGMNGYMSKPFEFRDFYSRVTALLETGKGSSRKDSALYDLSLLEDVGDRDYVSETITTFLDALPNHLTNLQQAFCDQNYDRLAFLAHKLKGTMGVFQARMLVEQLDNIETMARDRRDPGGLLPVTLNLLRQLAKQLGRHQ